MAQLSYSAARIDELLAKVEEIESSNALLPYISSSGSYNVFARFKNGGTSSGHFQVLVAGAGKLTDNKSGLYLVDVRMVSGGLANVAVDTLSAATSTPTFGYYTENGYTYFGVYRSFAYGAAMTAELKANTPTSYFEPEAGNFYQGTTAPAGWTTV